MDALLQGLGEHGVAGLSLAASLAALAIIVRHEKNCLRERSELKVAIARLQEKLEWLSHLK